MKFLRNLALSLLNGESITQPNRLVYRKSSPEVGSTSEGNISSTDKTAPEDEEETPPPDEGVDLRVRQGKKRYKKTKRKIDYGTEQLLEKYGDYVKAIEATQQELNDLLQYAAEDGYTMEERAMVERQIDERLQLREEHLQRVQETDEAAQAALGAEAEGEGEAGPEEENTEAEAAPETVPTEIRKLDNATEVKGKSLLTILKEQNLDMTLEQFIAFNEKNSKKFTVTKSWKGKELARKRWWCDANDDVYVPTATAPGTVSAPEDAPKGMSLEEAQAEFLGFYATQAREGMETFKLRRAEAKGLVYNKMALEQFEEIKQRREKLPSFLRGNPFNRIDKNEWDALIRQSIADDNTEVSQQELRVIHVIEAKPFEWSPTYFRDVVRKGCPTSLSFNDIVKMSSWGKENGVSNQRQFMREYEGLLGVEANYNDPEHPSNKFEQSWVEKNESHNGEIDDIIEGLGNPNDPQIPVLEAYKRRPIEGADGEYESLEDWELRIDSLEATTDEQRSAKTKAEAYYSEMLHTEDQLKTMNTERSQNLEKIADFQKFHERSTELLDALSAATEGIGETFEVKEGEETYWEERLDSAFQPIDKEYEATWADFEAGRGPVYKKTGLLSRRMDVEAARDRVESFNTTFDPETKEYVVDQEGIREDIQYYLEEGIMNHFMDPNLDIVEELKKQGITLTEEESEQLRDAQKEIKRMARRIRRLQEERLTRFEREEEQALERQQRAGERGREGREERKEARAERFAEKQAELRAELFGTADNPGLYQELFDQKEAIAKILQAPTVTAEEHGPSKLDQLITAMGLELNKNGHMAKDFTDEQRRFIQNGYIVTENVDLTLREEISKQEVLSWYAQNNPPVHHILQQLIAADTEGDFTRADIQGFGEQITTALNNMEYTVIEEPPPTEDLIESGRTRSLALAGTSETTTSAEGETRLSALQVGGGTSFGLKNAKGQEVCTLSIGATIGFSETEGFNAGGGAGVSKTFEGDYTKLTVSIGAGAGTTGLGTGLAITAGVGTEDVAVFAGGSLGVGFKPGQEGITLGPGVHGGIQWAASPQEYLKRGREKGDVKSGLAYIEAAETPEEREGRMDEIPEVAAMKADIEEHLARFQEETGTTVPESTREEILRDSFQFYADEMRMHGEAHQRIVPVTGLSVAWSPGAFPLPIPMIHLHIRGKTRVYPLTNHADAKAAIEFESNQAIYAQLAQEFGETGVTVHKFMEGGDYGELPQKEYGLNSEGMLTVLPYSANDATSESIALAAGNLEAMNKDLLPHGMELTPGKGDTTGLLKLNLYGELGETVVVADPSMGLNLIGGEKPRDIFIATDRVSGNLIITKQVFHYTRKENDQWTDYTKTVITIKDNPSPERNFNQFFQEGAGSIEFHGTGEEDQMERVVDSKGNVYEMGEFLGERQTEVEKMGWLTPKEDIAATEKTLKQIAENSINYEELDSLAETYFNAHKKEVLEALTRETGETRQAQTEQFQEMFQELKAAHPEIAEKYPESAQQDQAYGYMVNVMYRISYVHVDPSYQAEFARQHQAFFKRILSRELNPAFAGKLLEGISIDDIDQSRTIDLPPNATVYSVVGREGVGGLREDVMTGGKLASAVDYSDDPRMATKIIEATKAFEVPEETKAFLNTPSALAIYAQYTRLKGPEDKRALDAIYKDPSLATGEHAEVFTEFKEVVEQFIETQQAPKGQRFMTIKDKYEVPRPYGVTLQVVAGVREQCANPGMAVVPELVPPPSTHTAAFDEQYERARAEAKTDVFSLSVGYMNRNVQETPPPPPPEKEEPHAEESGDEGAEATGPHEEGERDEDGGNLGGAPTEGDGDDGDGGGSNVPGGGGGEPPE